jgi:hypothetical protein
LFLVERRDRAYRVAQHPNGAPRGFWAKYSPLNWIDPEPYQDSEDATWKTENTNATRNPAIDGQAHLSGQKRGWFQGKKHRKVVKMEFDDAFEGWGKVQAALVGTGLVGVGGMLWAVKSWI